MVRASIWTCIALVLLRLAIGWHFFFEGITKYRSQNTTRPFSSEGYFTEAEGPLGPEMRSQLGDSDEKALAKLTLANGNSEAERMPAALGKEWDAYLDHFAKFYKLNDQQKQSAKGTLDQAKLSYVQWLTDSTPKKKDDGKDPGKGDETRKIKKDFPAGMGTVSYEVEDKVIQRVAEYRLKVAEVREVYSRKLPAMGRDVEKTHLRELKNEATKMRADLLKDIDKQTEKMKESLATALDSRMSGFDLGPPENPKIDEQLLLMLELQPGAGDDLQRMPATLGQQWTDYAGFVKDSVDAAKRPDAKNDDEKLTSAKRRYIRWLQGQDEYTGEPLVDSDIVKRVEQYKGIVAKIQMAAKAYEEDKTPAREATLAAVRKTAEKPRKAFIADIKRHTDILKKDFGGFSGDEAKGILEMPKEESSVLGIELPVTKLGWLDSVTRWTLLIAGGCLLVGLFTRLSAVVAAGFLLMEYLSTGAFPWLPKSPMTEGNYLFVNKNVIEFLALMVLATTLSGRWLGLDAILCRIWPFRRRRPKHPEA